MLLCLEPRRAALQKRLFCEIFSRTGYFVLKFAIKVNFIKIVLWRLLLLHDGESDNRKLEVRVAHTVNDVVLYTVYYFPQNASGQWNTEGDGARNS
jgi:hypothetical protein